MDTEVPNPAEALKQEFEQTFKGTEVEEIFNTSFSPDTPAAYEDSDYRQAFNEVEGDEEKALQLYELWCRYDQAVPVIHRDSRADATIDSMIHKIDLLTRYTNQQINEIIPSRNPD